MATTTEARVDIGALAGELSRDVLRRAADSIVLASDWLDEDENELNQAQKVEIAATVMRCFDGVEASIARTLKDTLERDGVQTWGLSMDLELILGGSGASRTSGSGV